MARDMFVVKAEWDADSGVWYVSESNVPGLVAEGGTVEELLAKLKVLVPELIELNAHLLDGPKGGDLPIRIMAERLEHYAFGH